jgi:N-acetylglucosamine malate deacetylase 1
MHIDVLAFAAHPDDVELTCSGLLIKLKKQGYHIGIVDLTRGELGTRGSSEIRTEEAKKASEILGLDIRENAEMEDGNIKVDKAGRRVVIEFIRKYRPKIVLCPYWEDRHPDHQAASKLVESSFFYSGLTKIKSQYEAYRPQHIIYYFQHQLTTPTFIVDISAEFETKLMAVRAYASQFYQEESKDPETYISSPQFLESITNKAKYFGFQIGVDYGEPFLVKSVIKINNIMNVFA